MVNGMLESPAKYKRYPHLDLEQLNNLLESATNKYQKIFVVTESVFSMDGDYPDMKRIAAQKNNIPLFGFWMKLMQLAGMARMVLV